MLYKQYGDCGEDAYLSYLYGSDIACPNRIFYKAKDVLHETQDEIFETMQGVSLNQMVISILNNLNTINIEMINIQFIFKGIIDLIKISYESLLNLVIAIHNCLNFDQPLFPDVPIHCNVHEVNEIKSKNILNFGKTKQRKKLYKFNINKDNKEFWIKDCITANQKIAKKNLYETINEALYLSQEIDDPSKIHRLQK